MATIKRYVVTEYRIDASKARSALDQIRVSATASAKSLQQIEKASKSSASSLSGLAGGFSRAASAVKSFVAYMAVQKLQSFVDSTIDMNTRLLAVTGSTAAANAQFEELLAIGNRLGVGVDVLANSFAKLKVSLPEQSTAEVTKSIELIGTVLATTGATVQQTNAVFLQLSQALSSGALQGDEFRSVYENAPVLLRAWQDAIGRSSANLRDLSKNAELTTESFFKNLDAIRANVIEMTKMERPPLTIGRALVVLGNNLRAVLKDFEQATGLIDKTAGALASLANNLDSAAFAVGAFAAAWALMNLSATASGLGALTKVVGALSLAVQGLGAAFISLGAAFAIGGTAAKVLVGILSAVTFVGFYEAGKYIRSAIQPLGDMREELDKVEVVRKRLDNEGFRNALGSLKIVDDADLESLKRVRDEVQHTADVIQAEYIRGLEELDKWYNQLPSRQEKLRTGLNDLTREWGNAGAAAYDVSRAIEEYERRTQTADSATKELTGTLSELATQLGSVKSEYDALAQGGEEAFNRVRLQNERNLEAVKLANKLAEEGATPDQIRQKVAELDMVYALKEQTKQLLEQNRERTKAIGATERLSQLTRANFGSDKAFSGWSKVSKDLQKETAQFIADAKKAGINFTITSTWRNQDGSNHKFGNAVDLVADNWKKANDWWQANSFKSDLSFGVPNERPGDALTGGSGPHWHAQLAKSAGEVNDELRDMEDLQRRIAENRMQSVIDTVSNYRDLVVSLETPLETFRRKQAEINELKAQFEEAGGTFDPAVYYGAMARAAEEATGSVQGLIDTYMPAEAITRQLAAAQLGLAAAAEVNGMSIEKQTEILRRYKEELEAAAYDLYTTKNAQMDLKASLYGGFEDAILQGKKFRDVLKGILEDIARIILKATLGNALSMGINALFPAAKGASMYSDMPQGLYTTPTFFPLREPGLHAFASGVGLLGEAGPEYIMPAVRMPNGDMGVQATGAAVNVTVNNNAPGVRVDSRQTPQGLTIDIVENYVAAAFAAGGGKIARAAEAAYPGLRRGRL